MPVRQYMLCTAKSAQKLVHIIGALEYAVNVFLIRIYPWIVGNKQFKIDKVIQFLLTTQMGMLGDMFLWLLANLKQRPFT